MRSVIEEKTSRIIEVIISSVKPFQLMLGKIFGNALAGLTQFAIWFLLVLVLGTVGLVLVGIEGFGKLDQLDVAAIAADNNVSMDASKLSDMETVVKEIIDVHWGTLIVGFMIYSLLATLYTVLFTRL